MSIIEQEKGEIRIIERAKCDYCGKVSRPLRDDKLPRGWIEHTVEIDWEKRFEENPHLRGVTGWFSPFVVYHFCRQKHFELWQEMPEGPNRGFVATLKTKDEFE